MIVILQNRANNVLNNHQTGCSSHAVSQYNHILLHANKKGIQCLNTVCPNFLPISSFIHCVRLLLRPTTRFGRLSRSLQVVYHTLTILSTRYLRYQRILGVQQQLHFSLWKLKTTSNSQKVLY